MTTKKRTSAPRRARKPAAGNGGTPPGPPGDLAGSQGGGASGDLDASLVEEARRRYLNYALSVITSRALPDVRDGLKPVQRRILYAMFADEHLYPDAKYRKSAKVVGSVLGRYHPHGDTSVYDAMVRMAQDFAMRAPLVDGSGNFGSIDGDGAAAYRYTECRMAPPAMELLRELRQNTVPFRPNYDGTTTEPTVLPARFPNLLVNGSTGIAVGMATNIPPHNLREITKALVALADNRDLTTTNLLKYIQGPDFPTGGQLMTGKLELRRIYESGQGALKVRAEYNLEKRKGGGIDIVVTSIPYAVNKSTVVERIAECIIKKKLPQLNDVRDESTTDVRIVLELKKGADEHKVMAYLYKNTPLQLNFNMNLTCLVPTDNPEVGKPARVGIKVMLEEYLDFRFDTIRKRFEYELAALLKRIHILLGFVKIFNALDEAIRIIRKSDGKKDAAEKLMKRFSLDAEQVDAILELKLYKLARLEINLIREELSEKKAEAARIEGILKSNTRLWRVVKEELRAVADEYGTPRKTKVGPVEEDPEFDAADFIVDEDAHVVLTRDGWIKRMKEVKDLSKLRTREGDAVTAVLPGSTKENVAFFSNFGSVYVTKINDIPPTTGYGDPPQKLFKFKDGERIVAGYSFDPRTLVPEFMLAVSKKGYGMQFTVEPHKEETTRVGRKYARPGRGDEIVDVVPVNHGDTIIAATRNGHVLQCPEEEVNHLENPGKGVRVIKVGADDELIAFVATSGRDNPLRIETEKGGKQEVIGPDKRRLKSRGGKGHQIKKRSKFKASYVPPIITPLANVPAPKGVQ